MSTMYDALRKAEAERKKAAGLDVKGPEKDNSVQVEGLPGNIKSVALLVAVLVVFAVVFYQIKASLGGPKKTAVVQTAVNTVSTAQVPVTAAAPVKPKRAPGTYGLDGVIDAGENSMAIVNGKLLKIGGTIDYLVLKKIYPKEVELLNTKNNSTVILKIE